MIADDHARIRGRVREALEAERLRGRAARARPPTRPSRWPTSTGPTSRCSTSTCPAAASGPPARSAKTLPETAVVMLTQSAEDDDLFDSLRAGASGYLLKDTDPADARRRAARRPGRRGGHAAAPGGTDPGRVPRPDASAGSRRESSAAAQAERPRVGGHGAARARGCPPRRSPDGCSSPPRPCGCTSRRCCGSCGSRTGRAPSGCCAASEAPALVDELGQRVDEGVGLVQRVLLGAQQHVTARPALRVSGSIVAHSRSDVAPDEQGAARRAWCVLLAGRMPCRCPHQPGQVAGRSLVSSSRSSSLSSVGDVWSVLRQGPAPVTMRDPACCPQSTGPQVVISAGRC